MTRTPREVQLEFDFPTHSKREDFIRDLDFDFHLASDTHVKQRGKVKAETLAAVLRHLGRFKVCYELQATICEHLKIKERKLQRAFEVLTALDILVTDRVDMGRGIRVNHYRINWQEVERLITRQYDCQNEHRPDVPLAVDRPVSTDATDPSVLTDRPVSTDATDPSVLTDRPVSTDVTDPSVLTGLLYKRESELKESSKENTHSLGEEWNSEVVASALGKEGVSQGGARRATVAARRRGLTTAEVADLISKFRALRANRPSEVDGAWLYRWMTGESSPPAQMPPDQAQVAERARVKQREQFAERQAYLRDRQAARDAAQRMVGMGEELRQLREKNLIAEKTQ